MSLPVIHTLKHEHRVIEQVLRALEGVCFRLACKERIPTEPLSEMVDFISNFVDSYHHAKEETYLFPALGRQGIVWQGGPLGSIKREHEMECKLTEELNLAIRDLEAGSEISRQGFIETARKFIAHMTNHMPQEEAILFRLAEELVDSSDGEAMAEGFRQTEEEFGESKIKQYENLAASLEAKWAI
jgi:hemerythrin-like domain-containing protein